MEIFKTLFPIILCAVVGYGTNYIAIKMLFRPRKAIMIGKFRLPFTPGVIPKNQGRIARAVGLAVGDTLLTSEDIKNTLSDEKLKSNVVNSITNAIYNSDLTMNICISKAAPDNTSEVKEKINNIIIEKIQNTLLNQDYETIIKEVAVPGIKKKVEGSMLAMFLSDDLLYSFCTPISNEIKSYIGEQGYDLISPAVENEMGAAYDYSLRAVLQRIEGSKETIEKLTGEFFDRVVERSAESMIKQIHIEKIVENKINSMDIKELEDLVLSVMKQELQAVVNLGALIGALIGVLNLIIK